MHHIKNMSRNGGSEPESATDGVSETTETRPRELRIPGVDELRSVRLLARVQATELAEKIGYSQPALTNWEQHRGEMPLPVAVKAIETCGPRVSHPIGVTDPDTYRVPTTTDLRAVRRACGVSTREAADVVGIGYTALSHRESDEHKFRLPMARQLLEHYRENQPDPWAEGVATEPLPPADVGLSPGGEFVETDDRPDRRFWIPPVDELHRLRVLADLQVGEAAEVIDVGGGCLSGWERDGGALPTLSATVNLVELYLEHIPGPFGVVPPDRYTVPDHDALDALCRLVDTDAPTHANLRLDEARSLLAECYDRLESGVGWTVPTAEEMRMHRHAAGLSLGEAAACIPHTDRALGQWERGDRRFPLDAAAALAGYYREHGIAVYVPTPADLRRERERRGVSQTDVATVLGTTKSNVSDKERGDSQFSLAQARRVLDALPESSVGLGAGRFRDGTAGGIVVGTQRGYTRVHDTDSGASAYLHQLVAIADGANPHRVFSRGACHVHHRDGETWNNSPENLEVLDAADHYSRHATTTATADD